MAIPKKAFSHLLLAVLAVGALTCPCPASAAGEAASHNHHNGQHESPVTEKDGCQHSQCVTDCNRISAESLRKDAALPGAVKYPFDDFGAVDAETIVWSGRARSVAWTGPPPQRLSLPHETPVQRFDRLLD